MRNRLPVAAGIAALVLAVGCGGGTVAFNPVATNAAPTPTPTATPTPSPTPTPTPTPLPANPPVMLPTALSFNATGAANAQTATVTETGYNGALVETNTCAGIATVAVSGSTGPQNTYTITPVASGTCNVTATDAFNVSASIAIVVSTSGVIIQ